MRIFITALSLSLILAIGGCDKNGSRENTTTPSQPIKIVPQHQAKPVELVVRLCAPLDSTKIAAIASRHAVSVKNQPSPTLLVFIWNDQRTADVLIKELRAEQSVCTVEINQTYHALQPTEK